MNPALAARLVALSLLVAGAAAQKFPLADASGRQAALVDMSPLLPKPEPGWEPGVDVMRRSLAEMAAFVRDFCEPELEPVHEVQPVGERWLLVLGMPQQIAFVERLVATAAAHPNTEIDVAAVYYEVPKALFLQHVEPLLPKPAPDAVPVLRDVPLVGFLFQKGQSRTNTARVGVVDTETAAAMQQALTAAAAVRTMAAPRLRAAPMSQAALSVGEHVSYRKDYECKAVDGELVWDVVADQVFDGLRMSALCGLLDDERIALKLQATMQTVTRPIPEFVTTVTANVPGKGEQQKQVSIELPHVTGLETQQSLVLKDGASAIVAGDKGDGTFCVMTVAVTRRR